MRFYWGTLLLGYCNSSVNVFIYGRKNSVLRRAVGNFVRNIFNCRKKDDNTADFADRQRRDSMTVHHQATLPIRIRFEGDDSRINPTIEEEEEESINNNKPKTAESLVVAAGTLSSNDADSSL